MRRRFTKEESVFEKKKRGEVTTNLVKVKEEVVGLVLSDDERGGSDGGGGALLLSLLTFDFWKIWKIVNQDLLLCIKKWNIPKSWIHTIRGESVVVIYTILYFSHWNMALLSTFFYY